MVRRFLECCRVRLRRQQRQAAINLKSIHTDNFSAATSRYLGCDFGFAARGWADNEKGSQSRASFQLLIQTRTEKEIKPEIF